MTRTTPLLTIALLAIAGPALADDIDDISTVDLAAATASESALDEADEGTRHRKKRKATATKRTTRTATATPRGVKRTTTTTTRRASPAAPRTSASRTTTRTTTSRAPARTSRTTTTTRTPVRTQSRTTTTTRTPVRTQSRTTTARTTTTRTPVRTTTARPSTVHVRSASPRTRVVHTRPAVTHVRPRARTVTYRRVYPYHGVFVYGPRPTTHVHYHRRSGPARVARNDLPKRAVDRDNSLAIGVKGGSMISSTPNQQVYGDPGLGLVGRYRPAESVGLEMALQRHGSAFSPTDARSNTQVAGSVALFAFPWTRVSPYAIGGVTYNAANFGSEVWNGTAYEAVRTVDSQWGLHGGLGVEFALGDNFALDLEGRYIGWLDERAPGEAPGALQATAGLLFHFK